MEKQKLLEIIVTTRSSKTEIVGYHGTALKIKLKSPPVDNAANEELIRFLAEHFKVAKSRITIVRGQTSRKKLIKLT